ncbi:hypothetical protein BH09BAC1_BH09BAC1_14030 [soil metagenome]
MRNVYLLLFSLLFPLCTLAQDIHFSQFYASPLTLNPTLTGFSQGDYRVAAIYRNQWATVTSPYQTFAASYDMRILKNKVKKDIFGVGFVAVHDHSANNVVSLLSGYLSTSYHKLLSKKGNHYLGLGIQAGYVQRQLKTNGLTFPTLFNGTDFDPSLSSGENFANTTIGYFDLNAGLLWSTTPHERVGLYQGVSVYHLTQPKESFMNQDVHLKMRYTIHGGLRIKLHQRWYLTPNYIVMSQNKAMEINLGTAVEYHLGAATDPVVLSLGGWWRTGDAGIISAGAEFKGIRLGLAYDVTTSGLQAAPKPTGGFEIALIYTGKFGGGRDPGPVLVPCPRL